MMEEYLTYKTNTESFAKERPLGVSGILRCHNHADFLELCIDSCIDGLDELIAVYHDCTDDTVQILHKKQMEYPEKIRIYEYEPFVFPLEMDWETFSFVKQLPYDSIHLFSGYSNFALSKTTFRYVVKIDADQVYFPDKWKRMCDAYRATHKVKISALERLAFRLQKSYINKFKSNGFTHQLTKRLAVLFSPLYFSFVEKSVINDKIATSLSGINLFIQDDQWKVSLGEKDVKELYPLFNGANDHLFFRLTDKTYFDKWQAKGYSQDYPRILEVLTYREEILNIGFIWFHTKPLFLSQREQIHKLQSKYANRFVLLKEWAKTPFLKFQHRYQPTYATRMMEAMFSFFHQTQRKGIPYEMLESIKKRYKEMEKSISMPKRDYYVEFYEELNKRLELFVENPVSEKRLLWGKHHLKWALHTYLFYRLCMEREYYNQCRLKGMSIDVSMKRVDAVLAIFMKESTHSTETESVMVEDIERHPWYKLLNGHKGALVVYIFNARQLAYLTPLLHKQKGEIILLSEYEIPDEYDLPDNVMVLLMMFSKKTLHSNRYLETNFPLFSKYANTFDLLLQILAPSGVVCLEGAHYQERMLATLAENYGIPSFGIQQGWPSMMHAGFRHFPFRYFFTWGENFNSLWAKYNPHPHYIPAGYMYEVSIPVPEKKNCVSFFLQSPNFLSDKNYFYSILNLINLAAQKFTDTTFLVREHPECKLGSDFCERWATIPNIEIVSDCPLQDVYVRTRIVVSHFSSSLMEGVVHQSVPLVYDPTSDSRYYPDVEKLNIGRIAKTEEEFLSHLTDLLKSPWKPYSKETMCQWFAATDKTTLENIAQFIEENKNDATYK